MPATEVSLFLNTERELYNSTVNATSREIINSFASRSLYEAVASFLDSGCVIASMVTCVVDGLGYIANDPVWLVMLTAAAPLRPHTLETRANSVTT